MADHDEDSDTSDTEVLPSSEVAPSDPEGTVEMDREALIARIQADKRRTDGPEETEPEQSSTDDDTDVAQTVQVPSINEETKPTKTAKLPAVPDKTQNYEVPDSLMDELRKEKLHTLDIPLEKIEEAHESSTAVLESDEIIEFTAIVDREGRIQLPDGAVRGRYAPGKRVYVVMRVARDE